MKKTVISFSGAAYNETTAEIVRRAPKLGADSVTIYDDLWLTGTEFFHSPEFQWLYNHRGVGNENGGRGFGWFSFKPYVIIDALSRLDDGDMVLYLDADTFPIANFGVLYDECARIGGHMAFMATGRTEALCNRQWCKRDCFIAMGLDTEKYWNGPAAVARFMVFQKGAPLIDDFLYEWMHYCLFPPCQTFDPSVLGPELDGLPDTDGPTGNFREHRTEQAIYTNLCIKYGRKLYREACEFGAECQQDWDLYPQLFSQVHSKMPRSLEGSKYRNVEHSRVEVCA